MHLSVRGAGLLSALFGVGALVGVVPACVLAGRNPRATVLSGLLVLCAGTGVIAWAGNSLEIELARAAQGFGDALACTGGLTSVFGDAPASRRSEALGRVNTLAILGSFLGPVLALVAGEFGTRWAFSVGAVALALLAATSVWVPTSSGTGESAATLVKSVLDALGDPSTIPLAVQATLGGLLATLGSLRLAHAGWSSAAVALSFLCGAAAGGLCYTKVGRRCDLLGSRSVTTELLLASALGIVAFALAGDRWVLALLLSVDAALFSLLAIPTISALFRLPEEGGRPHGSASALALAVWAIFNVAGALGATSLAAVLGTSVPFLLAAGLCVLTVAFTNLHRFGAPTRA